MAEEYSIVYIDHIFFIYSSFDGHRGSFHILAIVDIAACLLYTSDAADDVSWV